VTEQTTYSVFAAARAALIDAWRETERQVAALQVDDARRIRELTAYTDDLVAFGNAAVAVIASGLGISEAAAEDLIETEIERRRTEQAVAS